MRELLSSFTAQVEADMPSHKLRRLIQLCVDDFKEETLISSKRLNAKFTFLNKSNKVVTFPQPSTATKPAVTDLTNSLSDLEIKLLSKGPKFCLSAGMNDQVIRDYQVGFHRLAYHYR